MDILDVVKLGKLLMTTEDFAMNVGSVAVTMFVFVSGRIDLSDEECFGDNSDDGLSVKFMKRLVGSFVTHRRPVPSCSKAE